MRLGFYYHVPAIFKEGKIYTPGYQAVFIDSLAQYCEKIICFLHYPRLDEIYQCNSAIQSPNIELVNIGLRTSVMQRTFHARRYTSHVINRKADLDVLLIRGASPLLPAMAHCVPELPKVLLLVSSYSDGLDSLPQPAWRKELIHLWTYWYESEQIKVEKKCLTFVNSAKRYQELYPLIPKLIEIKTTTISDKDFYIRIDTCITQPYHILFSGRISFEKGIFDILDALSQLSMKQINYIFDIVGMPENESFMPEFWKYAERLGIREYIHYHGFKKVGEELFSYYRLADVLIIASKSNFEGFPRTIWEAFSQSTPVIATSVSSIPIYLKTEQDALIVHPNDPIELSESLVRIFTDGSLRRRLIENGRKLAQNNTLEKQSTIMINSIHEVLDV